MGNFEGSGRVLLWDVFRQQTEADTEGGECIDIISTPKTAARDHHLGWKPPLRRAQPGRPPDTNVRNSTYQFRYDSSISRFKITDETNIALKFRSRLWRKIANRA